MAIYGQMANRAQDSDSSSTEEDSYDAGSSSSKKLSDFENMLAELNRNIDETLTQRFDAMSGETVSHYEQKKQEETPHFTLAESPTQSKTSRKDDDTH